MYCACADDECRDFLHCTDDIETGIRAERDLRDRNTACGECLAERLCTRGIFEHNERHKTDLGHFLQLLTHQWNLPPS